jgi:hypothetical protein
MSSKVSPAPAAAPTANSARLLLVLLLEAIIEFLHDMLAIVLLAARTTGPMHSFKSGVPWYDTAGNVIDAHGAGLLEHNETFYW